MIMQSIKSVQHMDSNGHLLVKDGVIIVFFAKRPFHEMSAEVEKIFNIWLKAIPETSIKWFLSTSAEHASKFTNKTIERCRNQLDPIKASKRDLSGFLVFGEEEFNASYQFSVLGSAELIQNRFCDETNLIEICFPTEFVKELGTDAFVGMAIEMAKSIRYDSGYATLSLNWSADSRLSEAAQIIVPIALRHPGYDVHMNSTTRFKLGDKCRGARWLTFLGDGLVAKLGEREALAHKLDPGIQVLDAGAGIAIRAGAEPLPGDGNRRDNLPLICSVARAIEPVTYFKDKDMLQHMFADDEDKLERWERRFLKDE